MVVYVFQGKKVLDQSGFWSVTLGPEGSASELFGSLGFGLGRI